MRIVVGKAANKTVVFNDKLKYIVFSPYWNVPPSIVHREILPAMQRDPAYLTSHNMEQTGTSGGFHDTPAKSLFDRQQRAFSHGCIRLAEPLKLAAFLLQERKEWTDEKMTAAMYKDKETWVTLSKPVAVEITYFTS